MAKSGLLLGLIVLRFCVTSSSANILQNCDLLNHKIPLSISLSCIRVRSFEMVDELISSPVIKVFGSDSIKLVKRIDIKSPANDEVVTPLRNRREMENMNWTSHVINKLGELLETHVLQIDFASTSSSTTQAAGIGRGRRQRMMTVMLFGIMAIGMIIIPIGFQLMSLLIGKAILMAKIALILSSFNGLKRVANSGVNFGLYRSPPEPPFFNSGFYDRSDVQYNHPREAAAAFK